VRVDHDLYYFGGRENSANQVPEPGTPAVTGPDQYFMLGDNTTSSSDSRVWTAQGVRLKDGSEVWWDGSNSEDTRYDVRIVEGKSFYSVNDVEGIHRTWGEDDVVREGGAGRLPPRRMSFVTRDRIVGRAFF